MKSERSQDTISGCQVKSQGGRGGRSTDLAPGPLHDPSHHERGRRRKERESTLGKTYRGGEKEQRERGSERNTGNKGYDMRKERKSECTHLPTPLPPLPCSFFFLMDTRQALFHRRCHGDHGAKGKRLLPLVAFNEDANENLCGLLCVCYFFSGPPHTPRTPSPQPYLPTLTLPPLAAHVALPA